jgi:hypothetical protein
MSTEIKRIIDLAAAREYVKAANLAEAMPAQHQKAYYFAETLMVTERSLTLRRRHRAAM